MFAAVCTALAAVGTGLGPVYYAARRDVSAGLTVAVSRGAGHASPSRARSVFVGIQAAASITIVALAALLVRALLHIAWLDPGYDVDRLLTVSAAFRPGDAAASRAFWPMALERVRALPGVERASLAEFTPFGVTLGAAPETVQTLPTDEAYFSTVGVRLVSGRLYSATEVATDASVAVISDDTARRFWGSENPVGDVLSRIDSSLTRHQIIGVVAGAMHFRVHEYRTPIVYVPMASADYAQLAIRVADPRAMAGSVRDVLTALSPAARPNVTVVADRFAREFERPRRYAALGASVALFALGLSVVGLFGVTTFAVRTRTREMGIRLALGAHRAHVVGLFLRDGLRAVVIGLAIGLLGALLAGRFLAGMLYGVSAHDPIALAAATGVLLAAAGLAVYLPTRRAAAVDPAIVLRDA
jgi:predicted permease